MKITLSKRQWELIGKKAGWLKLAGIISVNSEEDAADLKLLDDPNCPPSKLIEILKRGKDDLVSRMAAQHPNCPPEMLVEILKRKKFDGVSQYAANNPRCPPEAKAQWEQAIRQR